MVPPRKFSSFDFGDIDNDQDIDYVISGFNDRCDMRRSIAGVSGVGAIGYPNNRCASSAKALDELLYIWNQ